MNLQTEAATRVEITTTAEIEKPIGRWAALAHQWQRANPGTIPENRYYTRARGQCFS